MFKNYLKVALRNIARNKLYTTVNVLGLTLGLCACITIYTITHFEFSFDRYHEGSDRIYRVMGDVTESTGDISHFARVPVTIAEAVHSGLSGLDNSSVLLPFAAKITIPAGNRPPAAFESILTPSHFITTVVTGPGYFDIFNYHWLAGGAAVLAAPFKVVLTESRARQYFGTGPLDKMLGKLVIYDDSLQMSVAGIVADPAGNTYRFYCCGRHASHRDGCLGICKITARHKR